MIQYGLPSNALVRVVLLGGPLDGLRCEVRNDATELFMTNLGELPFPEVYFRAPERGRPWDVGRYVPPDHPYQSNGWWIFTWAGWQGVRPDKTP